MGLLYSGGCGVVFLERSCEAQDNQALLALGRLDSVSVFLPDISLFLYMYVRKEAKLVHRAMLARPMGSPNWIQEKTQLAPATVNASLRELEKLGIVKEITEQKRNRLYSYVEYIKIMSEGTELPQ